MKKTCDNCKKQVKEVGKLFKMGFLTLCKGCRDVIRKKRG